jgi:hypothetical protein
MTRITLKAGAFALAAATFLAVGAFENPGPSRGGWTLNAWTTGDSVRLGMKHRSLTIRWDQSLDDLRGLTREQLHAMRTPVKFVMPRDAGTLAFEGTLTLGIGGGDFQFFPDPSFASSLVALGYDPIGADDQLMMALEDISLAYAAEIKRAGIKDAGTRDLVRFHEHGIELALLRDLGAAGVADLTADGVLRLHDHGIGSSFIRDLPPVGGRRARIDEMIELHDHGVDPTYVARIESAGFGELSVEQIVKLHDHGVD